MYWTIPKIWVSVTWRLIQSGGALKVTDFQQSRGNPQSRPAADIAKAYAEDAAPFSLKSVLMTCPSGGYLAYHEDLDRTLFMGGDRPRVLPVDTWGAWGPMPESSMSMRSLTITARGSQ